MPAGGEGTGSHGRVDLMLTHRHCNIPQISTVIAVTNRPLQLFSCLAQLSCSTETYPLCLRNTNSFMDPGPKIYSTKCTSEKKRGSRGRTRGRDLPISAYIEDFT